jgi:hypothetical protein
MHGLSTPVDICGGLLRWLNAGLKRCNRDVDSLKMAGDVLARDTIGGFSNLATGNEFSESPVDMVVSFWID